MLRRLVYSALPLALPLIAACSDHPTSTIVRPTIAEDAVDPANIPFAQNVHLAALPAFDGDTLNPEAFNDFGEVVGYATPSGNVFKWQGSHGFGWLKSFVDSNHYYSVNGVNDKGQVLITEVARDYQDRVLIWDWAGNLIPLRPLGTGYACEASTISNVGTVVGGCNFIPTVWKPDGRPDALYPNGGGTFIPFGVVDALTDSGYMSVNITGHENLFTPTKQLIPMPTGAVIGGTHALNDSGWVVGSYGSAPAIWTTGFVLHSVFDGDGTMYGVTDDGVAVGAVMEAGPLAAGGHASLTVPVVWTAAHGLQRLPYLEPGWNGQHEIGYAFFINAHHQILGRIQLATGQQRWVMWTLPF